MLVICGGLGAPEAVASALTMRSMASRTWRRTSSSNVRTLSLSSASSGMTLSFVPAWSAPTVTTAARAAATSREVLRRELYAIPALLGAAVVVVADQVDARSPVFPLLGAALCFAIRMLGLRRGIDPPTAPPRRREQPRPD